MKNDRRQFDVVPAQHRVQDRIVEMPQRRIGSHAADAYVKTPPAQLSGKRVRAALDEIPAIRHAADDRVAPFLCVYRELGSRHHVPHHIGPADVRVAAIAAVVRQPELMNGELPDRSHGLELAAHGGRRRGIGDHAGNRHALRHQLELALSAFHQIAAAAEPADQGDGAGAADPRSDAATIHPCKCIWSAGRSGTPCSACR